MKDHLEHNHVWENGDDRYKIEEFPLYDSAEDEPLSKLPMENSNKEAPMVTGNGHYCDLSSQETPQAIPQTNAMGSEAIGNSIPRDYNIGSGTASKRRFNNRRQKHSGYKQFDARRIAQLFPSKQAREEILKFEEVRNQATLKFEALYDEIRPAIEEHERDSQDSVPTSLAEKWIEASCFKLKADLNLYHSLLKNKLFPPPEDSDESKTAAVGSSQNSGANHFTT